MRVLVTGSSGHLGEALIRTLREEGCDVVGLDIKPSPFTGVVGSIVNRDLVRACMSGVETVYHTATLHKPHVVSHDMQQFVEANIQGTLALLEEAVAANVRSFVFTSTTSTFGDALRPESGKPTAWVTEDMRAIPKNIYGTTKIAAEDLCDLFHRKAKLNCVILRTSRFFLEQDDDREKRAAYDDGNIKANEFLSRRVDLEDVVSAHLLASKHAPSIGFRKYIVSATTPFLPTDAADLRIDAPQVLRQRVPEYEDVYQSLGWRMFDSIDRVYVNEAARRELNWQPKYDFAHVLRCLREGRDPRSELSKTVGTKGYHDVEFKDDPYPVEPTASDESSMSHC